MLPRRHLTIQRVSNWLSSSATEWVFAHNLLGIVHRDIKSLIAC